MVTLTATLPDGTTETLLVDSVVTEGFGNNATITDFPREVGPDVSDNIRPEPGTLKLDLIISNTPLEDVRPLQIANFGRQGPVAFKFPTYAEDGFKKLIEWQTAGALLTVQTTMGERSKLAIRGIALTRDAKTGGQPGHTGGARISLDLKEIILVANKLVPIIISKDLRQRSTSKTGAQPAVNIEPSDLINKGVDAAKDIYKSVRGG